MQPTVFFEASFFAIPPATADSKEVEGLIDRILGWVDFLSDQNCFRACKLLNTIDILSQANCFPAVHNARALLELFGLQEVFSPEDVSASIVAILQKTEAFESSIDVAGAGIGQFTVDPPLTPDDYPADIFVSSLNDSLKLVVGAYEAQPEARGLIITVLPKVRVNFLTVAFSVVRDQSANAITESVSLPIVQSGAEFLASLSPEAVWAASKTAIQLHLAISLKCASDLQLERIDAIPIAGLQKFVIGEYFLSSLETQDTLRSATSARTVLKRCSQVLVGNAPDNKQFSAVRDIDKSTSRRIHISKSGEALRLMIWLLPSGDIEFANVGVKHALEIFEGAPQRALAARVCDVQRNG